MISFKNLPDFSNFSKMIKIDHHPFVESFCDIELIDDLKTSASEIIMELILNTELLCNKEIAELRKKGYQISDTSFKIGVESVIIDTGLHGRWEVVSTSPTIICETAHNEDGIKNLMAKLNTMDYDTLHVVYGCVNDKDYEKILMMLPSKAKYYFCTPSVPRGLDVNILHKSALNVGLDGERYSSPAQALEAASYAAKPGDVVVVTGSIFLVADVLRELGKPKEEEQDV